MFSTAVNTSKPITKPSTKMLNALETRKEHQGVITPEMTHSSPKHCSLIPFKCDAVLNIHLSTLRTIRA